MIKNGNTHGRQYWMCSRASRERDLARVEERRERTNLRYANDEAHREKKLAGGREWYWNLSGYDYNLRTLKARRNLALRRRRQRMEGVS